MRCLEGRRCGLMQEGGETRAGRDKSWGWTCSARLRGKEGRGQRRWGFHLGEKKKMEGDEQDGSLTGMSLKSRRGHTSHPAAGRLHQAGESERRVCKHPSRNAKENVECSRIE